MASNVKNDLESVYAQLISFSFINYTLPSTVDASLVTQQVNKRSVDTATVMQSIQQIQGNIAQIQNQGVVNETILLSQAQSYYNTNVNNAVSNAGLAKYLSEIDQINNSTNGVYRVFFSTDQAGFNKFCWYKKVIN